MKLSLTHGPNGPVWRVGRNKFAPPGRPDGQGGYVLTTGIRVRP